MDGQLTGAIDEILEAHKKFRARPFSKPSIGAHQELIDLYFCHGKQMALALRGAQSLIKCTEWVSYEDCFEARKKTEGGPELCESCEWQEQWGKGSTDD